MDPKSTLFLVCSIINKEVFLFNWPHFLDQFKKYLLLLFSCVHQTYYSTDQNGSNSDSESDFHGPNDGLDDIDEIFDDTHSSVHNSEDISVTGIVTSYLSSVKEKLQSEINSYGRPSCYENNTF